MEDAWSRGELIYPSNPGEEGQRWFLRTPVNPEKARNLVFIGINPSEATSFNTTAKGGDRTTNKIQSFFPLNEWGAPLDYRQMIIINLIPLIGQSEKSKSKTARKLPRWEDEEGKRQITESFTITEEIFKVILPDTQVLHLMWGDPLSEDFPWKETALDLLVPEIAPLIPTDCNVQAYMSESGFPVHASYNHWEGRTLCPDASGLLNK